MENKKETVWDVIVIGGGVTGCAILRKFALLGAKTLLLEQGCDILSKASKASTGILHCGFDAPSASLELECIKEGYQEFLSIHKQMNLPLLKTGALIIAWNELQRQQLPTLIEQANKNGFTNVELLDFISLYKKEPNLAPGAFGAIYIPDEAIIDPFSTPLAYLTQAIKHGAKYHFNCQVQEAILSDNIWQLQTSGGVFHSKLIINCCGTDLEKVDSFIQTEPAAITTPMLEKGEFIVYEKPAANDINSIIYLSLQHTSHNSFLTKTIFGNLLLGPGTKKQDTNNTENTSVDNATLHNLMSQGVKVLPSITNYQVTATYAGVRNIRSNDMLIVKDIPEKQWISVPGIHWSGFSAALGIANHVARLYQDNFPALFELMPPKEIIWPLMPNLSEFVPRDYQKSDNKGIVCFCERVTRRELENTFKSDVPPSGLQSLKRRTRATMGYCNGSQCTRHLISLIDNHAKKGRKV